MKKNIPLNSIFFSFSFLGKESDTIQFVFTMHVLTAHCIQNIHLAKMEDTKIDNTHNVPNVYCLKCIVQFSHSVMSDSF